VKRALLVAGLAVCLVGAVAIGFIFWAGSGTRLPVSALAGASPQATTTPPGPSEPPLASCNARSSLPPGQALFTITGRCHVSTDGPAQCNASGGDDFGADYALKTTSEDTAYFSLGIEGYTGPGTYKKADALFFVLYGLHLAQWQAPSTIVTITGKSIILPGTVLEAAPGTGATSTLLAKGTLRCWRR